MWAIYKKEISSFFATPLAYLIVGIFLILCGLFLWVFSGPFNILDNGFADMNSFFLLSPWVLLLLIPAICMRSFSEEIKSGTLELLYIKPISIWKIVLAKYAAAATLSIIAVAPTLLYLYSLSELGTTVGNIDIGLAIGSYIGLLFLIITYTAISIFTSSITDNQIVAFIGGLVICLLFYYLWDAIAMELSNRDVSNFVQNLGLKSRFETMARGIVDSRDLIYFLTMSTFFLFLTVSQLKSRKR